MRVDAKTVFKRFQFSIVANSGRGNHGVTAMTFMVKALT
jgi:hypothetical protein